MAKSPHAVFGDAGKIVVIALEVLGGGDVVEDHELAAGIPFQREAQVCAGGFVIDDDILTGQTGHFFHGKRRALRKPPVYGLCIDAGLEAHVPDDSGERQNIVADGIAHGHGGQKLDDSHCASSPEHFA